MNKLDFVLSKNFETFIIWVIIINAVSLGLETSSVMVRHFGSLLSWIDHIALAIFTLEIILKIIVQKGDYVKNPWNIFDFLIVAVSYVPDSGSLSVLRSLRVLRVFLLLSAMPKLKLIVRSLLISLPSIGSISLLLVLLFYVCGIIANKTFGAAFPAWFGTLPDSLFTLFQIMTLESWAMGIVRPICEQFPYAPVFFIPFVLISSFIMLNLFIGVIINAMNDAKETLVNEKDLKSKEATIEDHMSEIKIELRKIHMELARLSTALNGSAKD